MRERAFDAGAQRTHRGDGGDAQRQAGKDDAQAANAAAQVAQSKPNSEHQSEKIRPSAISTMRSQRRASAGSWVTSSKLVPVSRCRSNRFRHHRLAGHAVQIAGRLVRQQQFRPRRKRAGQRHTLLLATRKLAGQVGQAVTEADRAQAVRRARHGIRRAGQFQRHRHVLQRGHGRNQMERLEHDADGVAAQAGQGILAHARDLVPVQHDAAGRGALQPGQHHQQAGLSGAGGADQGDRLAGAHLQVDAAQNVDRPGRSRHGQVQVPHPNQSSAVPETGGGDVTMASMAGRYGLRAAMRNACCCVAWFSLFGAAARAGRCGCWCWAIRWPPAMACRTEKGFRRSSPRR